MGHCCNFSFARPAKQRKSAMARPELKQFAELEPEDFEGHPVWIGCHTADYGKPWYESTDEETFRPWTGKFPVDFSEGMLLVKASFELRDGSIYTGFVTPSETSGDLGTQQPQLFVGEQRFGFWGGMVGIAGDAQQALYATLNKGPGEIFPIRFSSKTKLAAGSTEGQIDGFYVSGTPEVQLPARKPAVSTIRPKWFLVQARVGRGFPQPEKDLKYKELNHRNICLRCGIFEQQSAPFRFKRSQISPLAGFWQPQGVYDSIFVHSDIATEIQDAGIVGVSFGPVLDDRTGTKVPDRLQMYVTKSFHCAEVSQLPTVTCRPNNEEVAATRERWPVCEKEPEYEKAKPSWWGGSDSSYLDWKKRVQREREAYMALPYCGRVKYHPPTSLVTIAGSLNDAPDLFQSAEWFGSGALAYRLTFASERFVALAREHKWKGLICSGVLQVGFSERTN